MNAVNRLANKARLSQRHRELMQIMQTNDCYHEPFYTRINLQL